MTRRMSSSTRCVTVLCSAGKHRSLQDGPLPGDLPPAKLFEDFFQLARDVQQGMEKEAGESESSRCSRRLYCLIRLLYHCASQPLRRCLGLTRPTAAIAVSCNTRKPSVAEHE